MSSNILHARSRLGVAARAHDADGQLIARRDLAAAKLEAYIRKTVEAAPALDQETRDRLALLLRGAA